MKSKIVCFLLLIISATSSNAQHENLLGNIQGRKIKSLNGKWFYIVDPYETGFYDYRFKERRAGDPEAYWNTDIPKNKSERKEHGYAAPYTINVPGDWNSQDPKFLYYEGTVWYKRNFDYKKSADNNRVFIYFGAVNYKSDVYLNGKKLGSHKGGFTPFNFEIPDSVLKPTGNFLVVKVDNKRYADEIPTLNTDWWNYGGITRDVNLVELPAKYIQNYSLQLNKSDDGDKIEGWVQTANFNPGDKVSIEIPELKLNAAVDIDNNEGHFSIPVQGLQYWSTEKPKLYRVTIGSGNDKMQDKIGFRTIETNGSQILLNGKPVFLRGISVHGEIPDPGRRAFGKADALKLLGWARELSCNMVRLAHYPHDEMMTRMADSLGILVWSEIPVYWTIDFTSDVVLEKAKGQLREMISRDINRASIIIWSVGNETPVSEVRTNFMSNLLSTAKTLDPSRLVSAALEVHWDEQQQLNLIDDPLGKFVDIVAFNEYVGWYRGNPETCRTANWKTVYDKPLFISETGAEALGGNHGDYKTMWTEEYQEWYYKEQVAMMARMPANFVGISPWLLADFRSPRRNNPTYQQGWNNKGMYDHKGRKKKAFYILKAYYDTKK